MDIKIKFLANHLGLPALAKLPNLDVKQLIKIDGDLISEKGLEYFKDVEVLLKPLIEITDEEDKMIAIIFDSELENQNLRVLKSMDVPSVTYVQGNGCMTQQTISEQSLCKNLLAYQVVVGLGYALPWMEFSVENLVGKGWVKLVKNRLNSII